MKVVNTDATWCTFQPQAQGQKKLAKVSYIFQKTMFPYISE